MMLTQKIFATNEVKLPSEYVLLQSEQRGSLASHSFKHEFKLERAKFERHTRIRKVASEAPSYTVAFEDTTAHPRRSLDCLSKGILDRLFILSRYTACNANRRYTNKQESKNYFTSTGRCAKYDEDGKLERKMILRLMTSKMCTRSPAYPAAHIRQAHPQFDRSNAAKSSTASSKLWARNANAINSLGESDVKPHLDCLQEYFKLPGNSNGRCITPIYIGTADGGSCEKVPRERMWE
ncbi:uncharacterized protein EDB93DRAFT_1271366 [Suillus bovinus]|uniref:uncharacterized protein n=1 Tax=Suillus bovinus TaxID=48563 RepID=UPI001B87A2F9|nr:uncharacterized protein EDB93DRAFT_1271366 [Suillus bovinus]KAG2153558.1 hypothetical protein EDB93DRAFT_1271366 [Suillus bovinus]